MQVLRRLDNIDEGVRQFFLPASKLVLESGDPEDALSRALAALSGLVEVPKPRRYLPSVSHCGGGASSVRRHILISCHGSYQTSGKGAKLT